MIWEQYFLVFSLEFCIKLYRGYFLYNVLKIITAQFPDLATYASSFLFDSAAVK